MKLLAVVVSCLFLPLQSFYYVDCCCGDFCTHKNACTGCVGGEGKDCDSSSAGPAGMDSCPVKTAGTGASEHRHQKACSHLSPTSEVTLEGLTVAPPIPADLVFLAVPAVQDPEPVRARDIRVRQFFRTRSDIPLHLLLSVLLI